MALKVAELDQILKACKSNRVQLMDDTMWMHYSLMTKMKELLSSPQHFEQLKSVQSCFTFFFPNFHENNILVKTDLDALDVLNDVGWYCIKAILFAAD